MVKILTDEEVDKYVEKFKDQLMPLVAGDEINNMLFSLRQARQERDELERIANQRKNRLYREIAILDVTHSLGEQIATLKAEVENAKGLLELAYIENTNLCGRMNEMDETIGKSKQQLVEIAVAAGYGADIVLNTHCNALAESIKTIVDNLRRSQGEVRVRKGFLEACESQVVTLKEANEQLTKELAGYLGDDVFIGTIADLKAGLTNAQEAERVWREQSHDIQITCDLYIRENDTLKAQLETMKEAWSTMNLLSSPSLMPKDLIAKADVIAGQGRIITSCGSDGIARDHAIKGGGEWKP